MPHSIKITNEDILKHIKLSGKLPEIIEEIVKTRIVEHTVQETGITVEVSDLQKAADRFRCTNMLIAAQDTYQWLEKHQLSVDDFERMLEFSVQSANLIEKLFGDQVEAYFYENQADYISAILYEVIFDDRDLAMESFYSIQEKEMCFYDVAHQYISDTKSRRQGGYLGQVSRRSLKPEVSAAVFAAKPPQVLKPIITGKGIHLILVEEIIKPELEQNLRFQIAADLFTKWLEQQREKFTVITQL